MFFSCVFIFLVTNCLPDFLEYNDKVEYATKLNESQSFDLNLCEIESDYFVLVRSENTNVSIFVQSTNAVQMTVSLLNNVSSVLAVGGAKTLEDIVLSFIAQGTRDFIFLSHIYSKYYVLYQNYRDCSRLY